MKYILNYQQLNEAKQVGIIYHFTSIENFHNIVKDNFVFNTSTCININKPTISFSRKSNGDFRSITDRMVRFSIDGNKLSEKYKLLPFADYEKGSRERSYGRKSYPSEYDEAEVILVSKKKWRKDN